MCLGKKQEKLRLAVLPSRFACAINLSQICCVISVQVFFISNKAELLFYTVAVLSQLRVCVCVCIDLLWDFVDVSIIGQCVFAIVDLFLSP